MLAHLTPARYAAGVAANSVTDLGRSNSQRRTSATTMMGAFFVPAMRYGGCAWDTSRCAGFLCDRSANPRTVAPIRCLAAAGDDSKHKGASPMAPCLFPTRTASARAAAHRAMARAALFADSSANTRLKRYNSHMGKARRLEGQEVAS